MKIVEFYTVRHSTDKSPMNEIEWNVIVAQIFLFRVISLTYTSFFTHSHSLPPPLTHSPSQLSGHTEGILSVSWCPSDPSLLLSCGKDNKTMMWDLNHLQPVFDLPSGMDTMCVRGRVITMCTLICTQLSERVYVYRYIYSH